MRKKKRLYLDQFGAHLYPLFQGKENKRARKMLNDRQPTTQLTSPQVWHEYAKGIVWYPGQPPLPHPHGSRPHESTFFIPQNVRPSIDQLQYGKAQDHDGLVVRQFIHSRDILLPLLTHIFNRAMCESFYTRWTDIYNFANPQEWRPHDAK